MANSSGQRTALGETSVLRVGGIDYLNALPLTEYLPLEGSPAIQLSNLVPSALASGLRAGDLDVALVPVVEYLERDDYLIVPDVCVSSYGAVESIRLYHRRPLDELRRVGLDTSSRTSALLARLFLRTRWRSQPEILAIEPSDALIYLASQDSAASESPTEGAGAGGTSGGADDLDAVLLIGDTALRRDAPAGWRFVDLGNEWTRSTGLPFVYAFWVCRGEAAPPALVGRLREARDMGISHIDDIVRRYVQRGRGPEAADRGPGAVGSEGGATWTGEVRWREYLSRVIQYELGPAQLEGLNRFFSLLGQEGLHESAPRPLRFVGESF